MYGWEEEGSLVYAYYFVDAWGDGDIVGLHVGPCLASDLHAAYAAWLQRNSMPAISIDRFIRVCKSNDTKGVSVKLEWVLGKDESSQTEAMVVRPAKGCAFPCGAKESIARYTARSAHVFADAVALGAFSLEFQSFDDEAQE